MGKIILLDSTGLESKELLKALEEETKDTRCIVFYKESDVITMQTLSVLVPHMKTKDFEFRMVSDQETFLIEFGMLLGSCKEGSEFVSTLPESMLSKTLSDRYQIGKLGAVKRTRAKGTGKRKPLPVKEEKKEDAALEEKKPESKARTRKKKTEEVPEDEKSAVKKPFTLSEADRKILNANVHVPLFSTANDPAEKRDAVLTKIGEAFHTAGNDKVQLQEIFVKEFGKVNAKRLMDALDPHIAFLSNVCSV